jgi:hypothetical protein
LDEYANLQREADGIIPGARPPRNWPHEGRIQFVNYQVRPFYLLSNLNEKFKSKFFFFFFKSYDIEKV